MVIPTLESLRTESRRSDEPQSWWETASLNSHWKAIEKRIMKLNSGSKKYTQKGRHGQLGKGILTCWEVRLYLKLGYGEGWSPRQMHQSWGSQHWYS